MKRFKEETQEIKKTDSRRDREEKWLKDIALPIISSLEFHLSV